MSIVLPLYKQQKDNTCALACLRMVLASYGVFEPEADLEVRAKLEETGTLIDELVRLARQYNLAAEIQYTTPDDLREILARRDWAIAYIDRAIFDLRPEQRRKHPLRDAKIHTVIPIRVSDTSVTFHDPLPPRVTRKSLRLFQQAHSHLGCFSVVCARAEGRE